MMIIRSAAIGPGVPDRVVFDLLINALVFGAGYRRIADERCSATTLRRRRDEWIAAGVMDRLEHLARAGYDKLIGLELDDVAVDGCTTKAPCGGEVAGRNSTDRGKEGIKRSTITDAGGLPLGVISAPANRHDLPLLAATLDTLKDLGPLTDDTCVHLDAGYHSRLARCTERRQIVTDLYIALANTIIIVRRLPRKAWTH
jgi:transposase